MRKGLWILLLLTLAAILLSACGAKSQEQVTKDLEKKVVELKGYKAEAKMTLTVGNEPQTYTVDIWHQKPNNYRVHLKNPEKEQSQMIVRNESGVYVLTPALNKSYRFQSDWPNNGSQAYLYESLVKDILEDNEATFTADENHYIFHTKTRYQNRNMLPTQEIVFKKGSLEPVSVKVLDANEDPVVIVEFTAMEFDAKFDADSFETKKNMTSAQLEIPVLGNPDENDEFEVKYSMIDIPGVEITEEQVFKTENGKRVLLSYSGEKSFTIIQESAKVVPTAGMEVVPVSGDVVDLGFAIGALADGFISWTEDGVEYTIFSDDLTPEELVMVAQSVQGGVIEK